MHYDVLTPKYHQRPGRSSFARLRTTISLPLRTEIHPLRRRSHFRRRTTFCLEGPLGYGVV